MGFVCWVFCLSRPVGRDRLSDLVFAFFMFFWMFSMFCFCKISIVYLFICL